MTNLHDFIWIILLCCMDAVSPVTVDICNGYEFSASCGPDEIIVMETAEFGRMDPGKCLRADKGTFGCTNDVLFLVDSWCSGRTNCEFQAPNGDIMEANKNCVDELAFLRASHTCVKVAGLSINECLSSSPNILRDDHNVISNHVTDEIGCGTARSPWVVRARAGQIIEISIVDFNALSRARSQSLVTCADVYGFVVEKTLNINQTICGQKQRDSVIYRSKTNTVEIYIKEDSGSNFLLKYTANGCSDPKPPAHAWYKRNGNEAVIGCETNDKEWRLTCTGNTWSGNSGNCDTTVVSTGVDIPKNDAVEFELSTVVIVAGIIGGTVVLAVAVIVCGVVYIQKYKDRQEKKYTESQNTTASGPPTTHAHYRPVSSTVIEGQDDYLQPNTNARAQKPPAKTDEPLIHIWETPLPDPTNSQQPSRDCTIHRNKQSTGKATRIPLGSNSATINKENGRTGTSYYSPNTGHKYYVLDRET